MFDTASFSFNTSSSGSSTTALLEAPAARRATGTSSADASPLFDAFDVFDVESASPAASDPCEFGSL